ncbi:MAG: pilus assembly protein N-terminal domain-containing protein [Candidatus Gastranaerophilales bacterium]|nr:pilus assembly protein N-terminal domain-containing protein [Candidatus Gastranaerophilales bacterium]
MTKQMKKFNIFIATIFIVGFAFSNQSFAQGPQIRGLNMEPVSIENFDNMSDFENWDYPPVLEENSIKNSTSQEVEIPTAETSKISDLYAIVGKSKFIKFDEPVKRMSITNPDLADIVLLSPTEMLLNGKNAGSTSLIIWGESSENPVFFDLVVQNDSESFLKAVNKVLPNENIDIAFTEKGAVLAGKISSSIAREKIKELAKAYNFELSDISESPSPQVLIEVKIVEASRSFTKNISSTFSKGNLYGNFVNGTELTLGEAQKGFEFGGTEEGVKYFLTKSKDEIGLLLKAGEKKGFVKILAEPKLIAKNGKEASFNAGQQVPVPSGVGEGGNISYEYKDVGINVKFNPTILEDSQRVILSVEPEVSEIDSSTSVHQSDGSVVYGIKTRKVSTTVELNDGSTLVIAGLLKRTDNDTRTQIPLLGDIPVLGKLFKASTKTKDETELMIFVTPKILQDEIPVEGI